MLAAALWMLAGDGFDEIGRPFLDRHCIRCHDAAAGDTQAGGLDLVSIDGAGIRKDADDWDWLRERVEFEEMPPAGEAAPPAEERAAFVAWLRTELGPELGAETESDGAGARRPLPPVDLRRLTAHEFSSAAQHLFGVDFDATRILPEDPIGHGFDHIGAAQSLSEAHFVSYLRAAEIVAGRAIPIDDDSEPRVQRFAAEELSGGRTSARVHWRTTNGSVQTVVPLPRRGRYIVRARVFGSQAGPDPCRCQLELAGARSEQTFDVAARSDKPIVIECELDVERAGDHSAGVRFVNDYFNRASEDPGDRDRNLAVVWIEVEGPIDAARPTPFLEDLLERVADGRSQERGLRQVVGELASLVWRRPGVADADVRRLVGLSTWRDDVAVRLRLALVALLASPRFIFKEEGTFGDRGAAGSRGGVPLDGHEVATRLAGFLWRSVPDRSLHERVIAGDLTRDDELVEAATAMLADPRADEFVLSFGEQWLQLRGLGGRRADRDAFPEFSTALRRSMVGETRRVLVDSLRERRSLWDLVDGESTFVDRRLAEHYGLDLSAIERDASGVAGADGWERVSVAATERRGLLGHSSVLFLTSEATRTSPVKRGKWVLEVLLGSTPPPPPPGAGNLPQVDEATADLSFRERFEAHRADPTCASCHARMDPLGFGLEAFDAIGRSRPLEDPARADAGGVLPDGRDFDGPVELYDVLREEDRFLEALVERMWVYALGRGLERADRASIASVVAALDPEVPTFEQLILAIIQTPEFRRIPAR